MTRELAEAVAYLDAFALPENYSPGEHGRREMAKLTPLASAYIRLVLAALAEAQRELDLLMDSFTPRPATLHAGVHSLVFALAAAQAEAAKLREATRTFLALLPRDMWREDRECLERALAATPEEKP